MSLKHLTIGALVAVCTFVAQAVAQKNELSGILGRTFISDQGIQGAPSYDPDLRFGKGLTFEANYARRVLGSDLWSLALEVPFVVNPDEDSHTYANPFLGYRSYFVTPAARLNVFPDVAVSPWVSFGGGFGYLQWKFCRCPEQGERHRCIAGWCGNRCEDLRALQLAR